MTNFYTKFHQSMLILLIFTTKDALCPFQSLVGSVQLHLHQFSDLGVKQADIQTNSFIILLGNKEPSTSLVRALYWLQTVIMKEMDKIIYI